MGTCSKSFKSFSIIIIILEWLVANLISLNLHVNTVFCRMHAPARTPKIPEGRLYSGIIRSKSNDVGRCRNSRTCSFVFNGGKIAGSCILNSLK